LRKTFSSDETIPNGFIAYIFDEIPTKDVTTTGVILGEKYVFCKIAFIQKGTVVARTCYKINLTFRKKGTLLQASATFHRVSFDKCNFSCCN
jgi:hypothetical protein